ncbi:MAG: hypothetical protein K9N21_16520 [Deltaproteobacteria bacterium]|nr:hypothetical protein [Deltaproteobacteria bacterium]
MNLKRAAFLLVVSGSMFLLAGCGDKEEQPEPKPEVKVGDVQKEAGQAMATAKNYTQQQMEEYQNQIEKKLETFNQELGELKVKTDSMKEDAKGKYEQTLITLQEKQMEITEALKGLKQETGEDWASTKEKLDQMMDDLQKEFDQANTPS